MKRVDHRRQVWIIRDGGDVIGRAEDNQNRAVNGFPRGRDVDVCPLLEQCERRRILNVVRAFGRRRENRVWFLLLDEHSMVAPLGEQHAAIRLIERPVL